MDGKSRPDPSSSSSSSTSRAPLMSGTRVRAPQGSASRSQTGGMTTTATTMPAGMVASSSKAPMRGPPGSGSGSGLGSGSKKIRPPSTHPTRPHPTQNPHSHSNENATSTSAHSLTDSKNRPQASGESVDTDGDTDNENVKRVYERFRALGMPEGVSFEAFAQIMGAGAGAGVSSSSSSDLVGGKDERGTSRSRRMPSSKTRGRGHGQVEQQQQQQQKGDWNIALTFLSTHLVGRQEASRARGVISRARAELAHHPSAQQQSKIKAPSVSVVSGASHHQTLSDLLVDPMAVAVRKRDMAYRALDAARREWEDVSKGVGELDAERKTLTDRIAERRRVLLLLGVLERREEVRIRRLGVHAGGMGTLLAELKKRSALAMREFEAVMVSTSLNKVVTPNTTSLQRSRDKVGWYKNTMEALAKLHAHHVAACNAGDAGGSGTGGPDIGKAKSDSGAVGGSEGGVEERRLASALDEMKAVACRRRLIGGREEDERRLEALVRSNDAKRMQLQEKINKAVGLGWLCEEYIELISTFRSETAKDLGTMLDEESRRVVGYVDTLRESIVQQREKEREVIWVNDVRDGFKVWEAVRMPRATSSRLDCEVSVNTDVMERKGRKADHGFALAAEIQTLLADITRWP